jgi:sugar lactone lactonase YvrE
MPTPDQGQPIQGKVHGGQQPIAGAHIYLFAANTTGYGGNGIAPSTANASISLLTSATGYSDALGNYVLTGADGSFSITGDYTCAANQQVYLYALGGNPGAGTNSASGLMAILGNCPGPTFPASTFVFINEVSTIAAAYSFAGFASDATHVSSSGTALAQTGIANAFATASNLETLSTGVATSITASGTIGVPQANINTLANILASCVNSAGPTSPTCSTLFKNAKSGGSSGITATDTATAAINMAHNPGTNIAALYGIPAPASPFAPALTAQPNDFTLGLQITGGGVFFPQALAIDASGAVWVANGGDTISKFSSLGAPISPTDGFTVVSSSPVIQQPIDGPQSIAIDSHGNAWIANNGLSGNPNITELSPAGVSLSGNGFSRADLAEPLALAIDGSDNIWVATKSGGGYQTAFLQELSNSGNFLSPLGGYTGAGLYNPNVVAVDQTGNVWLGNSGTISELTNAGVPLSPSNGYRAVQFAGPNGIAIDASGSVWLANSVGYSVVELSNSGAALSPTDGYPVAPVANQFPYGIAIDGGGNVWTGLYAGNSVLELNSNGQTISPANGYNCCFMVTTVATAVDGSGNVWVADYRSEYLTEIIGAAVPVVTPLSAGVKNKSLGTRP